MPTPDGTAISGPGTSPRSWGFLEHNHDYRTTWFHGAPTGSITEVAVQFDSANAFWQRILATTEGAIARWGRHATIGYADLGGNLDIMAGLRGTQDLLYDLHDAPEEVESLCSQITAAWLRYYDQLDALVAPTPHGSSSWAPLWAPARTYMLQSDFCYMVGPAAFERFVLPDLERCCESVDFPFTIWTARPARAPRYAAVDRQIAGRSMATRDGAPPADQWPEVLHRIRAGGKLCQIYVDRAGAFRVARSTEVRVSSFPLSRP